MRFCINNSLLCFSESAEEDDSSTTSSLEKEGKVRRAKLYYLRDRKGKAARVKVKETN